MSMTADGRLDTDEAMRMLDLALAAAGTNDMALSIENNRSPVQGESMRTYSDGKHRLDILGYDVHAGYRAAPGGGTQMLALSHLYVVRRTDSATPSIASLLRGQSPSLKLVLSIYRAGGDNIQDADPMVEFVFDEARVAEIALLTGGALGSPCEVIRFGYRSMKIEASTQRPDGTPGPKNTCELSAQGQS
ncbi:MAG: hypothetical protein EOP81_02565 [Variovorax sp.]|nr:MAG: hypothetical protein EOP81_02565 [Variovorax sp.]